MGVVGCGGRIIDAGGGVAGLHCSLSHCRVVDGGGGVVVALSTEVVRWRWWSCCRLRGGGVVGVVWWKME